MQRKPSLLFYFLIFVRGICMGIADLIPGVSGGTIAFITGIYDDLLASLKNLNIQTFLLLVKFRFREAFQRIHWRFLTALILGMGLSMALFAHFFQFLLNHFFYSTLLYAFFLGLILASIVFCVRSVKTWTVIHFICSVIAGLIAFGITWIGLVKNPAQNTYLVPLPSSIKIHEPANYRNYNSELHALTNIDKETVRAMASKQIIQRDDQVLSPKEGRLYTVSEIIGSQKKVFGINGWQIFCGLIAICAMLLPGISGSYLLAVLGMYHIAIGAIVDVVNQLKTAQIDFSALSILINLAIGILIGLIVFSRVVGWLLKKYRSLTLATLIGFMIGALGSVWPFWHKELQINPLKPDQAPILQFYSPIFPSHWNVEVLAAIGLLLFGLVLVIGLTFIASKKEFKPNLLPKSRLNGPTLGN